MLSRNDCSPRTLKRINKKENTDEALKYEFYRQLNHLSIMKLDNETDKMNYSSWLTRLDSESSDLKKHLIKILFISMRSDRPFQMFLSPPPDNFDEIELDSTDTMYMVKYLQDNNKEIEPIEQDNQETKHKRSAAVATNMRSYTTIKTSHYYVQSFYVRSDFPIYTWFNPTAIMVPSSYDHNEWELYLNRFQILTENKEFKNKHRNECDDIMKLDQVSKEITNQFNWHPYSILTNEINRPKRTAGSIRIDLDVANQPCNQQQIDDAAFAIVFCKVFPGFKMLSPTLYSATLTQDPKFVFKMTGVTLIDYSNLIKLKKDEPQPNTCRLKQLEPVCKKGCKRKDPVCPKPISKCSKPQLPVCPTEVKTENESNFENLNKTYQECSKPSSSNSKCLNNNLECANETKLSNGDKPNLCLEIQMINSSSPNTSSSPNNSSRPNSSSSPDYLPSPNNLSQKCLKPKEAEKSKEREKCWKVNAGGPSLNDSSNCDWARIEPTDCNTKPIKGTSCKSNKTPHTFIPVITENQCNTQSATCQSPSNVQKCSRKPPPPLPQEPRNVCKRDQPPPQEPRNVCKRDQPPPQEPRNVCKRDPPPSQEPRNVCCSRDPPPQEPRDVCKRETLPSPPRNCGRTDTSCPRENVVVDGADRRKSSRQYMNASTPCSRSNDERERCLQDQHQSCPAALPSGPHSCNVAEWDPDVSSYSVFTNRRFTTDNGSRLMSSERRVDDRVSVNDIQPAEDCCPVNDIRDDDNDVVFSDGSTDWSAEAVSGRFQDGDYSSGSLSTLTSETSSIGQRMEARHDRYNGNDYDCMGNSDRFPYEGGRDFGRTLNDITEDRVNHIEDVSMQDMSGSYWEHEDAVSYVSQTPVDIIIEGTRISDLMLSNTTSRSSRGQNVIEPNLEGNNSRSARRATDRRQNTSISSRSNNSQRRNNGDQTGFSSYSC